MLELRISLVYLPDGFSWDDCSSTGDLKGKTGRGETNRCDVNPAIEWREGDRYRGRLRGWVPGRLYYYSASESRVHVSVALSLAYCHAI